MKLSHNLSLLCFAMGVFLLGGCDKPQSSNSNSSNSGPSQSTADKLPEQQVIDIVNATTEGDTRLCLKTLKTCKLP